MTKSQSSKAQKIDTQLTQIGRNPSDFHGFVNPPVVHASTVLFPDIETMSLGSQKYSYARRGTPTTESLENAITELEGAAGTKLATSGLNAIATACLSCLKAGDHILIADTAYGPTREFADTVLPKFAIEVDYYDPALGANIKNLFKDNTTAVLTESPGSLTFEMQDIPALASAAKNIGATVIMDNTWASPLYCRPLDLGVDLSIQAGTKYIVGHSDVMLGTISASERAWPALHAFHGTTGLHVAPDDVYLALRGLRTLSVRLERHMKNALVVADWLKTRPEVANIRYPALESDPGHSIWKRDFTGASSLFAFDFRQGTTDAQSTLFFNTLTLFGLGYSWGGFESLAIPVKLKDQRTATAYDADQKSARLHIGLEDPEDLINDLAQAFDKAFG